MLKTFQASYHENQDEAQITVSIIIILLSTHKKKRPQLATFRLFKNLNMTAPVTAL